MTILIDALCLRENCQPEQIEVRWNTRDGTHLSVHGKIITGSELARLHDDELGFGADLPISAEQLISAIEKRIFG